MTQNKSHLLLAHYLKQLKLPTMRREYAAVVTACTQDHCDYVSFLLRLVEREALDREQRAAERRMKNAPLPAPQDPGYIRLHRAALALREARPRADGG